jgi:bifunctional enzyme CysN/CysC
MAVAASTADVALLLVDAERGVKRQTFRHLTICALMGVQDVVIAINKLDAVGFDKSVHDSLAQQVATAAQRLEIPRVQVVPVSALSGDNVISRSDRTPWYDGPTVLDAIEGVGVADAHATGLRIPIQSIIRSTNFRGLAGSIARGTVSVGDVLQVAGQGTQGTVVRIAHLDGDRPSATMGDAVCLQLDPDIDVTRGDLLEGAKEKCQPADRFAADLVWMGDEPLAHGRSYLLVCGPLRVPATVTAVRHRQDVENGVEEAARVLKLNEVGRVELALDRAVPLDAYGLSRHTGGFVLVDRVTADTVAAGMTRFALRRSANVVPHAYGVDRSARQVQNGHPSRVVWFTGLSGSGKSTVADAVERRLHTLGYRTIVLDGDNLRSGLTKDLGFTPEDRAENVRRVAEVAKLLVEAGVVVLVALVSPFRSDRRAARDLFAPGDFVEVFVDTPLEVCIERDTKGLYAKASSGQLPNLSGVGQAYEPPISPDLTLSGVDDLDASATAVVEALLRLEQ